MFVVYQRHSPVHFLTAFQDACFAIPTCAIVWVYSTQVLASSFIAYKGTAHRSNPTYHPHTCSSDWHACWLISIGVLNFTESTRSMLVRKDRGAYDSGVGSSSISSDGTYMLSVSSTFLSRFLTINDILMGWPNKSHYAQVVRRYKKALCTFVVCRRFPQNKY